jgi:hypothetical protein
MAHAAGAQSAVDPVVPNGLDTHPLQGTGALLALRPYAQHAGAASGPDYATTLG